MSAHRPRILVVDDEPQIHRFLGPALEANGYEAIRAMTAAEGLAALSQRPPEAMILDLGLPDRDGQDVLTEARTLYSGPILILSARDRETEKIEALDRGADDYVEKPFGIGELLARLRAALRHTIAQSGISSVIRSGELEIDLIGRRVSRDGAAVRLSPREYDLLTKLVEGGGKVVTHRQLLTAVWGPAHVDDVAYLRVFVGHLRQKLEIDPASPHRIVTEPGVGYRFIAE
ncbi:response regulator [Caulobacter sp. S45]|jgi:two-component system KDP operon response regulator KdpE|uniref:response regulator n=1 Tax=Caulobacter sp. S45 TaxID=1641861 RepID=UPI00131E1948|nr:response regulator [Caulobacter sp. S45]